MSPYGTNALAYTQKDQSHILPIHMELKNSTKVILNRVVEEEQKVQIQSLLNKVLEEGNTYPQYGPMSFVEFEAYYLSHDAYILSTIDGQFVGSVYIKPNFPGRASHICNGGFLIHEDFRNLGAGKLLSSQFEILAKDLGYTGIFFNLVFVTNIASIKIWTSLGYNRIGIIPKAANLKDFGLTDAIQFHKEI